jgi:hypothetical protein
MDMGAFKAFFAARPAIQSRSAHSYSRSQTMEAVLGEVSQKRAKGSPLSAR